MNKIKNLEKEEKFRLYAEFRIMIIKKEGGYLFVDDLSEGEILVESTDSRENLLSRIDSMKIEIKKKEDELFESVRENLFDMDDQEDSDYMEARSELRQEERFLKKLESLLMILEVI